MTETHPADLFGHFADRYEALEALISPQTDPEHIQALLNALNEGFRAALDHVAHLAQ